jgi:hypothetical protein
VTVSALDLQVRNSGLASGFIRLSIPGDPTSERWHGFGTAEFVCVTCPVPYASRAGPYEIVLLDERCRVVATLPTAGGHLLLEIDPGPTIRLGVAPPLGDWLPGDSMPLEVADVPCRT